MASNGSELFLDRATRVRKIQQIAQFLASIEGRDPQDRNLYSLAQKFENQIFTAAMNVEDYNDRINKKLSRVQKVRQQQAAAQAAAAKQEQAQQLDPARLQQQQQQTRRIQQLREQHARQNAHQQAQAQQQDALQRQQQDALQRQQQVVSNNMLQQPGLPLQLPATSSGASAPGASAVAAAATVAWPNLYISPDSAMSNVPGAASVSRSLRVPIGDASFQQGASTWGNAVQSALGVDAVAQAAANVGASAAMTIPRQGHLGPGSQGVVRGVSSGMVMAAGQPFGSAQCQVDADERAKQQRSLRAEELRNIYQEDIHYFVQHGSSLLKKLHKTRPASQNSEQVLKLVQYVKEGHNALLYINRCHYTGHVPSAASLQSLEHTLIRVHKASNALQTQQNNIQYSGGTGSAAGAGGAPAPGTGTGPAIMAASQLARRQQRLHLQQQQQHQSQQPQRQEDVLEVAQHLNRLAID